MLLRELINGLSTLSVSGNLDIDITGISCDSRKTFDGDVFCAIRGYNSDAHRYLKYAILKGASACIVEEVPDGFPDTVTIIKVHNTREALSYVAHCFYGNPSQTFPVIGITGTNGKSTVSYLIADILKNAGYLPAVMGTLGVSVSNNRKTLANTTPGSLTIARLMKEIKDARGDVLVMEVSSHSLMQDRVRGVQFDAAVFLNITNDHLDFHKTMDEYLIAKSRLFDMLELSSKKNKVAVLNCDDPAVCSLLPKIKTDIITFGFSPRAQVRAIRIKMDARGTRFTLVFSGKKYDVWTSLIGGFNISNCLAAFAVGIGMGIDLKIMIDAVRNFIPPAGRMMKVPSGKNYSVIVDYAHTPDALSHVLTALREIVRGRIILVFGCGGQRDIHKRELMGAIAGTCADISIITNDNPRQEDPQKIVSDIKKGFDSLSKCRYEVILDREKAIYDALSLAKDNDIVVVAGKGHEQYQLIGDEKIPFDDANVIKHCLKNMNVHIKREKSFI